MIFNEKVEDSAQAHTNYNGEHFDDDDQVDWKEYRRTEDYASD